MKKSLKKFIFEKLEKGEYIMDNDVAKFVGSNDFSFGTVEQYKNEFRKLEQYKERFKDFETDPTTEVRKCESFRSWHTLSNAKMREKNEIYKIPKTYFDYMNNLTN